MIELKGENALEFLKKYVNGHRIVSTGDLTEFQISEAQVENRMFVDEVSHLGWVALPWELTTSKDREREQKYLNKA
ncbi:MAG: hypothetical protein L0G38_10825 [Lactococcus sp.]|nr:hypothetical protein [Lactococcus sp.]